jgi:ABC-type branched-subunit amino acid transport system substrate-binding protein
MDEKMSPESFFNRLSTLLCRCAFILLTYSSLIFVSCASVEPESTPAREIKPIGHDSQKKLAHIKKQVKNTNKNDVIPMLKKIKAENKGNDLEPEIDLLLAQEYQKNEQWDEAGTSYLRAARSSSSIEKRVQYCLQAIKQYKKVSNPEISLKGCDYCLTKLEISGDKNLELRVAKVGLLETLGHKQTELLKMYVDIMASSPHGESEAKYRGLALQTVESKLNNEELLTVASDPEYGFTRGYAYYKLGRMAQERKEGPLAKEYFTHVVEILPETDLADSALKNMEQFSSNQKVNPTTVGVILPLSGKFANVGQRTLRGLQMGLGLDGSTPSPLKLAIIDSEGNPDVARRGVEELVKKDNVIAVVGSLLSKTANAVSDQAQVMGVPNIAMSQKSDLTSIGDKVFRYALTSETQVRTLVRYAIKNLGIKRFAIMYPNDKFGVEYANIFWDEVLARGGEVTAAQVYDIEETNYQPYVQRLVGTFYVEDRNEEYQQSYQKWSEKQKSMGRKKEAPEEALAPVVDFDAIFIADGLKAVGQIIPMLAYSNIKNIKIFGPSLWNTDAAIKRLANPFNQIIFVDNMQVAISDLTQSSFVRNYKTTFGETPGSFEIQGYDVGSITKQILSQGVNTREDFVRKLAAAGSLNGALGPISISADREMTRPVVALTIEGGQIKPVKDTHSIK